MKLLKTAGLAMAVAWAMLGTGSARADDDHRYNWSGLYFGAHLGGAWSDATALDVLPPVGGFFTPTGNAFNFDSSGVIGGGQIGLQHQFGHWVVGGEISGSWADLDDRIISPYFPASDTEKLRINPIFTATARLGYAWDRWMAYAKAGYAGADVEFQAFDRVAGIGYQQSAWHHGYAVGAGLEYAVSQGIRIGLDYTFVDLQAERLAGLTSAGGREEFKTGAEVHSVTARLNFLLGRSEESHESMK